MRIHTSAEGWQLEGNSAEAYEQYLASAFSPWARQLTALAGVKAGDRVLDVGCGTGIVARHAAERAGPAGRVVGVDINQGMLDVAQAASEAIRPSIVWRLGNATELPFPAAAFDIVCCEQAMQFFSDPVVSLREMHRVLAPGGRAAVSVCRPIRFAPAYVVMADALDRYVGSDAGAIMRSPFAGWDVAEFRNLFVSAGFQDVHVRIEVGSLRYPSCEEFLRREAASSPLAAPVGALSKELRRDLISELEASLADYVDDDGLVCALETCVALARR